MPNLKFDQDFTKASRTGCLVAVCERNERLGGLGGPFDKRIQNHRITWCLGWLVLQGNIPDGKWVMVGYQFPPVRDYCPPLVCDYWRQPGRQREQVVLTFDQERHVPFGACYAQKEHAAFRSSWNRIAPRRDVSMDREISLETSISLYIDRWRVENKKRLSLQIHGE